MHGMSFASEIERNREVLYQMRPDDTLRLDCCNVARRYHQITADGLRCAPIDASIEVLFQRILAITAAEYEGQIVSELGLSLV